MDHDVYQRFERILNLMAASIDRPLSNAELAREAGLSEFHFLRTFSAYVGTTPDRYARYLQNEYVRARIQSATTTELTYELGLSSPSRLSDLTVTFEALTPGQWARNGQGVEVFWGTGRCVFGQAVVVWTERGILRLEFVATDFSENSAQTAEPDLSQARWTEDSAGAQNLLDSIFLVNRTPSKPLHLCLRGTNFQIKVWEALLQIPRGRLVSYQDIARSIGNLNASRAVGTAVGSNEIAYLIPCHRVVRKWGELGNYKWGIERKRNLIAWEASPREMYPN